MTFGGFFTKSIRVIPAQLPVVTNRSALPKKVSTGDPLTLSLDSEDHVFDYKIAAGAKSADCTKNGSSLLCDVPGLQLAQATTYSLSLQRTFNGRSAGSLFTKDIATVESVKVVSASITANQTIYDDPREVTLTLNRPAATLNNTHLYRKVGENKQEIPITALVSGQRIVIRPKDPLPRVSSLELTVGMIKAADGGLIAEPYSLSFATSGGPKAQAVNIASYKVPVDTGMTITFDSPVLATQKLTDYIHLEVNGVSTAATINASDKQVTISPQATMPRCAGITIKVLDGLQNSYGVSGGSAWKYSARTICQTVARIGTSRQGRPITAYSYGSGPSKIAFVGTIHGNEKSANYLLTKWIDDLELQSARIPANRTIVVVPTISPDGFAASKRTNSNNVDLNRNFPANDWKSAVTLPDKTYLETGGGTTPLSEPESYAIATYLLSLSPRLIMSYHAAGAVASPNDSGDSQTIARKYADLTPVGYLANDTGGFFDYDTTGAMESWLHDKHNLPAILVELNSKTGDEFKGHRKALWYIAELP